MVIELNTKSESMPAIFQEIVEALTDWRNKSKFTDDLVAIHLGVDSQATGILAYARMQTEKNVC